MSPLPGWSIDRRAVCDRLANAVADTEVTLVCAAPGSGKSTLLHQWASRSTAPLIWVRFRATDSTPARSVRRIVDAIAAAGGSTESASALDLGDDLQRSRVAEAVRARLPATGALVLEDVHHLSSGSTASHLDELVAQIAEDRRVIVVSRSDPPWPLARWRVEGRLSELRQADLDLDDDEAISIVEHIAPGALGELDLKRLVSRCDGWTAGIVLAALALRGCADPSGFVDAFSGADQTVADYLFEEVYGGFSDEERHLLLCTSVCGSFNGELAAELTGRSDSSVTLADLAGRLMLMTPVEGRPGWFRHHDLLAEMLRFQLTIERPEAERDLLRRAADWHGRRASEDDEHGGIGHVASQVTYLTRLGDWSGVAAAVRARGRIVFRRGVHLELLGCLQAIPPEHLDCGSALALASIYMTSGQQWRVDEMLHVARRRVDDDPWHLVQIPLLAAGGVEWERTPEETLGLCDEVASRLDRHRLQNPTGAVVSQQHPDVATQCSAICRGRAHDLLDQADEAVSHYSIAHSGSRDLDVAWRLFALAAHSLTDARRGESADAESMACQALVGAGQIGMQHQPLVGNAHLALAIVAVHRGDLDGAERHLDDCRRVCTPNNRWQTLAEERIWRSEVLRRRGQPEQAFAELDALSAFPYLAPAMASDAAAARSRCLSDAGRTGEAQRLLDSVRHQTRAVRESAVQVAAAIGEAHAEGQRAAIGLTPREAEVLQAMSGRATNADIAAKLHISVHTLKTHQRHVYEKLLVSSRNEAVDRAEALGLL